MRSTTCVLASSVLDKWHHCALTLLLRAGNILWGSAYSARHIPLDLQRQANVCVSSDRLASRAERSSLCQPDHFGPVGHTRRPRQRATQSRSQQGSALSHLCPRKLCARQMASLRLNSPLESRQHIVGVCVLCATHPTPSSEDLITSPLNHFG